MPFARMRNSILRRLAKSSPSAFAQARRDLEPVVLERGTRLGTGSRRGVYFIDSGLISLVARTRDGSSVEVAIIGREGVAGIPEVLTPLPTPYSVLVQLSGLAYRMPAREAKAHVLNCSALHDLLIAHMQLMVYQLAQSALCNRFHNAIQRLSRWLLLAAARAETDRLDLTHEFIATMVGAPRSAITEAAALLRRKGIIEHARGLIVIRSQRRLRHMACECTDALALLQP